MVPCTPKPGQRGKHNEAQIALEAGVNVTAAVVVVGSCSMEEQGCAASWCSAGIPGQGRSQRSAPAAQLGTKRWGAGCTKEGRARKLPGEGKDLAESSAGLGGGLKKWCGQGMRALP